MLVRVEADRGRSAERLITFTDAVVAIAVTLLALPLTETTKEVIDSGFGALLQDKGLPFLGFVISFFVIARLWWAHHRIFTHIVKWDTVVVYLTIFWLFSVVLLAPVTAVVTSFDASRFVHGQYVNRGVIALYIGTMAVSSVLLTALAWYIRRHPALTDGHDSIAGSRLANSLETSIGFLLALLIGTLFPAVNYYAILVLAATGRIGTLIERRRARRR